MTNIRGTLLATALGAAIAAGGVLTVGNAHAAQTGDVRVAQIEVNIFSGHRYCWYDDAWDGPGWYWCGYSHHHGYGWGGGYGWNSWRGGHEHSYYSDRGYSNRGYSDRGYRDRGYSGGYSGRRSSGGVFGNSRDVRDQSGSQHSNVVLTSGGHSAGDRSGASNSGRDRSNDGHSSGNHWGNSNGDRSKNDRSNGDQGPH